MLVEKYVIEGYHDPLHSYGYFKHWEIFVAKYSIVIRINEKNKIQFISHADCPNNNYAVSLAKSNVDHPIDKVEVNDDFIEKCFEIYTMEKKINECKKSVVELLDFDTFFNNQDLTKIKFDAAMKIHNKQQYKSYDKIDKQIYFEAIDKFIELASFTQSLEMKALSLYNVACGYAKIKEKEKMYEFLEKSIFYGYNNWQHLILDDDLQDYREEKEFVSLVRKVYEANSEFRPLNYAYVNGKLPQDLQYLKDHKINKKTSLFGFSF